jgi:hypothetical protein
MATCKTYARCVPFVGLLCGPDSTVQGSLRVDVNVSVRKTDATGSVVNGPRVEVKNLNSVRAVERAIGTRILSLSLSLSHTHTKFSLALFEIHTVLSYFLFYPSPIHFLSHLLSHLL